MRSKRGMYLPLLTLLVMLSGCDDPNAKRIQDLEQSIRNQSEQFRQLSESHRAIAEASRQLVEQDAAARAEWTKMQGGIEKTRAELIRQQDLLHKERRELLDHQVRAPVIAEAIITIGGLALCLLPLLIIARLLTSGVSESAAAATCDLLLVELIPPQRRLSPNHPPLLGNSSNPTRS